MLPQKFSFEIFKENENKKWLKHLIQQLNKDLHLTGIDFEFHKDVSPQDLYIGLQRLLFELINKDFRAYVNLLYRVDVSEKQLKDIQEIEVESVSNKVAILILRKEWQKLYFRSL